MEVQAEGSKLYSAYQIAVNFLSLFLFLLFSPKSFNIFFEKMNSKFNCQTTYTEKIVLNLTLKSCILGFRAPGAGATFDWTLFDN